MTFSLRFEAVDYDALSTQQLESLSEDIKTSWASAAGVAPERVSVTLRKGSLITEIEILFEGEDEAAEEQAAESMQQGVENFSLVTEVIKESPTLSSVLGIQDRERLTVDEVESMTQISSPVTVEKEQPGDEEKKNSFLQSGKRIVIFAFGTLVVLSITMCGLHSRFGSKKTKAYLEAKRKDTINQMNLLPQQANVTRMHIRNPLSDSSYEQAANPMAMSNAYPEVNGYQSGNYSAHYPSNAYPNIADQL